MLVKNNFDELKLKIDNLEKKLEEQNKKIDLILKILNEDIKDNCSKMSEHIDFIKSVYDRVKAPMYYICDKFSNVPSLPWY